MLEGLFLRLDASPAQQRVEIEHLVRRLVDDLPREQVFDRSREIVDLEPLPPAAIDVIKHPLEDPKAADEAVDRVVVEAGRARRRDDVLDRSRAALVATRRRQFLRERLPRQLGQAGSSLWPRDRTKHDPARALRTSRICGIAFQRGFVARSGQLGLDTPNRGAPPMDLRFSAEELAFREEVRGFIRDNLPDDIREKLQLGHKIEKPDLVRWQRILNKKGWAAFNWPKEWGGPGWTPIQRMMFLEEIQTFPAPEVNPFNVTMLGPVLIQFGSDEQKRRFLPRAANLDDWWCQGFSEPGAGSDLAALKTAARREGDHYIVNGQKIWTSTAHMADWCFCLVRTNPQAAKKQEGISFLLIDMKTPGITVRPIISIDGEHHLNEVFFDDVKVPVDMRVYEENKGWDVAKFLLGNERTGIARIGKSKERINFSKQKAKEMRAHGKPLSADPEFRRRIAALETELKSLEITQLRVLSAQKANERRQDPLTAVLKLNGTELLQATTELAMDVAGPLAMPDWADELEALSNEPELGPVWATEATRTYLFLRAASIYGGTNEIMKNIVSKGVLGL